jgi:hypothetical protein
MAGRKGSMGENTGLMNDAGLAGKLLRLAWSSPLPHWRKFSVQFSLFLSYMDCTHIVCCSGPPVSLSRMQNVSDDTVTVLWGGILSTKRWTIPNLRPKGWLGYFTDLLYTHCWYMNYISTICTPDGYWITPIFHTLLLFILAHKRANIQLI